MSAEFPIGFAGHFGAWMDRFIREDDHQATFEAVAEFLAGEPDLIEAGWGWSKIVAAALEAAAAKKI